MPLPRPWKPSLRFSRTLGKDRDSPLPLRVRSASGRRIAPTEPAGENGALIVCHRHTAPLFSCKRGPLGKYSPGIFPNSPPKMRPTEKEFRPLRWATKGLCPFGIPTTFYKRWTKILLCRATSIPLVKLHIKKLPAGKPAGSFCCMGASSSISLRAGPRQNREP